MWKSVGTGQIAKAVFHTILLNLLETLTFISLAGHGVSQDLQEPGEVNTVFLTRHIVSLKKKIRVLLVGKKGYWFRQLAILISLLQGVSTLNTETLGNKQTTILSEIYVFSMENTVRFKSHTWSMFFKILITIFCVVDSFETLPDINVISRNVFKKITA